MSSALRKTLLVVNPAAQSGRAEALGEQALVLLREQGVDVELRFTEAAGHAAVIANEATDFDTLITLGGDGLIHETAQGLIAAPKDERPTLGVIPVGSGNDYARTLGISQKIETAIAQLLTATPTMLDVGVCNGEVFVETLSFGLDAGIALDTVERRKHSNKINALLYIESGINQLLHHFDTYHVSAVLDGEQTLEADIKMLAVQIGKTYGGGFIICPDAQPDDGLFDLCYCEAPVGKVKGIYVFLKAKNAGHVKYPMIHFAKASSLKLTFDKRPPCQMDGEEHVADTFEVSILPRELRVLKA